MDGTFPRNFAQGQDFVAKTYALSEPATNLSLFQDFSSSFEVTIPNILRCTSGKKMAQRCSRHYIN